VTDLLLHYDRPDITYVLKDKQEVFLIDIAVPYIVHIIVEALGSIPKDLASSLDKLCLPSKVIPNITTICILYCTHFEKIS